MLTAKLLKQTEFALTGEARCRTSELQLDQRDTFARSAAVTESSSNQVCPSCGETGCNCHGSLKSLTRYRCQSAPPVMRRARRGAYESWLADIAS